MAWARPRFEASAAARAAFQETDDVLGVPLSRTIFEGPAGDLVRSENAQPAILCVSVALLRAVQERLGAAAPRPAFVAGHSLGEYTALVAAGALDFADALRLVRRRGELMQAAAAATPSGMAALIGLGFEDARRACEGTGAQVANANSAEQVVIAGPNDALALAIERAKEAGARRALPLDVAGAFHTEVMRPAQTALDGALRDADVRAPSVPVVANTTAEPVTTSEGLRGELAGPALRVRLLAAVHRVHGRTRRDPVHRDRPRRSPQRPRPPHRTRRADRLRPGPGRRGRARVADSSSLTRRPPPPSLPMRPTDSGRGDG